MPLRSPVAGGETVVIRTATHTYLGRIVDVSDAEIVLEACSWVAESGRWSTFLTGKFDEHAEIEVYPDACPVSVARGAIVEVARWPFKLPTTNVPA